jgi:hypothetical protein
MRFRNPWIHPRVDELRIEHARAYLLQRGWKELPQEGYLIPFDGPFPEEENVVVFMPTLEAARDFTLRTIELITDIAKAEGRYANDVVLDMLDAIVAPPNHVVDSQPLTSEEGSHEP